MSSNADILRRLVEAHTAHDYETVAELLADDCVFIDCATGEKSAGRDAVMEAFKKWESAFPDMEIDALNVVSTENGAAGEFLARGIQTGPLGDIPATNKNLEEHFSIIGEVEGGKFTGMREYYDAMTLMAQLGLVPEAAKA
jgi:steroid delta-isomerase-like uncharacterized protein